jgi:PTH1 family peptidyl-tRNA hydrolase
MLLFVGLGNPGPRYAKNRHNIGFMAVESISNRHNFAPHHSKFQGEISEGTIDGQKILILRPMTFMNESGRSVSQAASFYKIPIEDIYVFHDELDLAPGKLKVKVGGGHAGHNGLRSIMAHVGEGFNRIRMGIGHPGHKDAVHSYVLNDFAKADQKNWLEEQLHTIGAESKWLAKGDGVRFMTAVAQALQPNKKGPKPKVTKPTTKPETVKIKGQAKTIPSNKGEQDTPSGSLADKLIAALKGKMPKSK